MMCDGERIDSHLVEVETAAVQTTTILSSQNEVYEPWWLGIVSQVPSLRTTKLWTEEHMRTFNQLSDSQA